MKRTKLARAQIPVPADVRRGDKRYPFVETGTLWVRGEPFICSVANISASGALLEVGAAPPLGGQVLLQVSNWGRFEAEVVHGREDWLGLAFTTNGAGRSGA